MNSILSKRMLGLLLFVACFSMIQSQIKIKTKVSSPLVDYGLENVRSALKEKQISTFNLRLDLDDQLQSQAYAITPGKQIIVRGGDKLGLMYGLLELSEKLRLAKDIKDLKPMEGTPFIKRRGIKFNIPLDARTPSYDDTGDAALKNIGEMWNMAFWTEFLDEMAKNRYNTLTLWNPHPFPSMIKLTDYPDVALDDVFVPSIEPVYEEGVWGDPMNYVKVVADNLRKIKSISIDDKITFWKSVMRHAKNRGIKIYFITWNINLNSVAPIPEERYFGQRNLMGNVTGKYGINNDQDNQKAIDYVRACVKEFILTYPDLAGIGVTPSENMEDRDDAFDREKWLYASYGKGVEDAKKEQPGRSIELIHRVWLSGMDRIENDFVKNYPDSLTLSFKYAKARLYSSSNPPWTEDFEKGLAKRGLKSWWNLRNDDIFHFRWGDPDYVRDFLKNLPPEELTAGYHMGSDGYVWARETISKFPKSPRELEINKHWFKFMLWGRLGYDNNLNNSYFSEIIQYKFPEVKSDVFLKAWMASSKVVPLVNQFHWRLWDFHWAVEGCMGCRKGFHSVYDFIECPTMAKSGLISIPDYVKGTIQGKVMMGKTPLHVADELEGYADETFKLISELNLSFVSPDALKTIDDMKSFAFLGKYYAEKIRGATAMQFSLINRDDATNADAVAHLTKALEYWKSYAKLSAANYNVQMLARTRKHDWLALTKEAEKDILFAKQVQDHKWTSLFNGKDLTNWEIKCVDKDKSKEFFQVENGTIEIDCKGQSDHDYMWLMTKNSYSDFILRLEFKIYDEDRGNSGIQIRSNYDDQSEWMDGPQIDISPKPVWRCGMIWDETRENARWLSPNLPLGKWVNEKMAIEDHVVKTVKDPKTWGPWNRMVICAKGNKIKVYLNDRLVTDYDGKGVLNDIIHQKQNVGKEGKIAIQIHKQHDVKMAYRNVWISEL